ncbi:MAG TPA: hypothetical protein VLB29_07795 [Nocardioidaceae bacterium]|nr:hypothetical protein [Nocardioidaceae bacterium]
MASIILWGPVVVLAAVAGVCGYVADRLRAGKQEVLLRNGLTRARSEATLRYYNEVGDSSNA